MFCCGYERTAKFCSTCGKKLDHDPLKQLLAHVEANALKFEARASGIKSTNPDIAWLPDTAKRWRSWVNALKAVMPPVDSDEASR